MLNPALETNMMNFYFIVGKPQAKPSSEASTSRSPEQSSLQQCVHPRARTHESAASHCSCKVGSPQHGLTRSTALTGLRYLRADPPCSEELWLLLSDTRKASSICSSESQGFPPRGYWHSCTDCHRTKSIYDAHGGLTAQLLLLFLVRESSQ